MQLPGDQPSDAEELLALSCLKPEAAPIFISLVKRAPAALQLVKTNPVLFSLVAFQVTRQEMSDEEIEQLMGKKKRDLVGWLGGINQEAGVKFVERFEVPANYRDFLRTLGRISDRDLLERSTSRPLSEVFQERRYFEATPELREVPAFKAELSEATRTIGAAATTRLISEIEDLSEVFERDLASELQRCVNGAALDELRQKLISELHESAPERLQELPGYPRTFPRAPAVSSSTILPIENEHELHLEGQTMNHCVATMVHEFLNGDSFLFRVFEPERATLKVKKKGHRLVVDELKLADNEEPSPGTYDAVEAWLSGGC